MIDRSKRKFPLKFLKYSPRPILSCPPHFIDLEAQHAFEVSSQSKALSRNAFMTKILTHPLRYANIHVNLSNKNSHFRNNSGI